MPRDKGLDVLTAGDGDTAIALLDEVGVRVIVADKHLDGRVNEEGHALAEAAARGDPTPQRRLHHRRVVGSWLIAP